MRPAVGDLSETALIARIRQRLPPPPPWLLVGIGDDAAVVEPARNRVEVLSVDALVEGIHFDRAFVPPLAIGHRALAVNLSDLAAMGAEPRLALLSFALPPHLPLDDFDGMLDGLTRLAARHRIHVAGGNLTRSPGPLMIDITVAGSVKRRQALVRGGARPGDDIYVSGAIGAAAAGLSRLKELAARPPDADALSAAEQFARPYLYPEPRVRLGLLLGRNRAASACIDLSDGLADGVHRICEASGVGAIIEAAALPIGPAAAASRETPETTDTLESVVAAITAGDDYELLFTVRPRSTRRLKAAAHHGEAPLTRIGRCTEARAVMLRPGPGSPGRDREMPRAGYDHFR